MGITLNGLSIRQGDFTLTADISFPANSTTAIIGPSGGGKSTLLMALAGFVTYSGRIDIDRRNIDGLAPQDRPLSILFQENNLFPHLDVFSNVALGVNPDLKLSAEAKNRVEMALERVGLPNRSRDLPASLSGGQRQRVALARALLRERPVLLLDEPFEALGPALRHEMLDLVAEIRAAQEATLLLVTHNPDDARRIAAQTSVVADGRVLAPRETSLLLDDPPPVLAAYLG